MEMIRKEKEKIEQENSGLRKWTKNDDNEIGNLWDPYDKL